MSYLLVNFPQFHYEDPETGLPARDWKVYTYEAGTTTPTETYINKECTILNTQPVVLDYNGNAVIYTNKALKIILTEPTNDQNTPHLVQDYLMVPQVDFVRATEDSMANNLYTVSSTPAQTVLTDQMLLIFTPLTDSLTTTTSHTFVGSGENDLVWFGPYTGTTSGSVFTVQIDGTAPDTIKWKKDGGAWTTGVPITGSEQILLEGISFKFARTTGHTLNDLWALTVELPVRIDLDGLGAKIAYENINGTMTAVGAGMRAGFPCQFLYSPSQGAWVWVNPAAPSQTSPAPTRVRKEVADNYTVVIDDAGNEVAMTAEDKTFTLPLAADFANQFVYLQAMDVNLTTITAQSGEIIYGPYDGTGDQVYYIGKHCSLDTIQIQSDSVYWHILTEVKDHGFIELTGTGSWLSPFTGNLFITAIAGGGGGTAAPDLGGGAGQSIHKFRQAVTKGVLYDFVVGDGGGADANGQDTTFAAHGGSTYLTLTGGVKGSASGTDGEDSDFGYGSKGIGADATGSGAGGFGNASPTAGSDGMMILEW